jgi:hypothetical protein
MAWVDGDRGKARGVYGSLPRLKLGEGWIWAPDRSVFS